MIEMGKIGDCCKFALATQSSGSRLVVCRDLGQRTAQKKCARLNMFSAYEGLGRSVTTWTCRDPMLENKMCCQDKGRGNANALKH